MADVRARRGRLLRVGGRVLEVVGAAGVVLGGAVAFEPPWHDGFALAVAGAFVGGLGRLLWWAGRRRAHPPERARQPLLDRVRNAPWMTTLSAIGLRCGVAALGTGCVLLVVLDEQGLGVELGVAGFGALHFALLALLLVGDVRAWRAPAGGSPSPDPPADGGPRGRPSGAEWACVGIFNGFAATALTAGALASRSGDVALLALGLLCALLFAGPTHGVLTRWRRHRR
ncbi:hypothetical protein [Streptomyces sp. NPDC057702]|uniref:hypothetical protein n=1 Tax=unclassified Streptomyces TaxID=2593676 RepID=UPI0036C81893